MLKIEIISPTGVIFAADCSMSVIPSESGEIGVMKDHEAFVARLKAGKILVYDGQQIIKELEIEGGFAQIKDKNSLVVLLD